ncbi:MAG: uncharacterized protein A8A55_1006 [Amphiamblys sp. WSBS2006]|nr:MAG: uncharacterized protein A8A55_1006 [Amphiamblys sp. WSBS2006]
MCFLLANEYPFLSLSCFRDLCTKPDTFSVFLSPTIPRIDDCRCVARIEHPTSRETQKHSVRAEEMETIDGVFVAEPTACWMASVFCECCGRRQRNKKQSVKSL